MAARPEILGAVLRIFHGEVFRFQRMQANALGHVEVNTGAVLGLQRFGGSLNLHCHVRALFFDGVFIDKDEALRFMPLAALTLSDLEHIAERVMKRTLRFLKKRRFSRGSPKSHRHGALPLPGWPCRAHQKWGLEALSPADQKALWVMGAQCLSFTPTKSS